MSKPNRNRLLEIGVILALLALFASRYPKKEPEPELSVKPAPKASSLNINIEPMAMSEDALWVLKTATQSYSPVLPAEKLFEERASIPPGDKVWAPE